VTRIEVSRSGGFAGLTRTWSVEVSSAEAEERWLPLLEQADPGEVEDAQRDRFVYHIAVGYREVTVAESAVQGPWKELVEWVKNASAGERYNEPGEDPC
jgi:hypothetical protein